MASRRAIVNDQFTLRRTALNTLRTRNAALLAEVQTARDAYEDTLASSRGLGTSVNGMRAGSQALAAVDFAVRQLGKDYEWAAEGPATYDCSGLVLASYLSVGVTLPRVSRYQYGAGTPVLASQLLPGDLLFFSTDRADWRQIHHVAIYLGDGKMIHAPTFGEKVKISSIWWSEYFGATRVVPAVAGPATSAPTPTRSATPTHSAMPTPTSTPPPTPTPTPTGTPTPTTQPSPTPDPTATPSPTVSATPSLTPSPTPTPTPTPTAAATSEPTSSTEATTSPPTTAETTATPTA